MNAPPGRWFPRVVVTLVTGALGVGGCGGGGPPAERAPAARAAVGHETLLSVGLPRQVFLGWGASVVTETKRDPLADPLDLTRASRRRLERLVFRDAGIGLLRIWSPAFGFGGRRPGLRVNDGRFALMRRVRRFGVKFVLTGADAPSRMKRGSALRPGFERAYASSLVDVLVFARDRARAPFSYVSIGNELDNPNSLVTMSPSQASIVDHEVSHLLGVRDLHTQLLVGDNTAWPVAARFAAAALRRPLPALAGLASHAYWGSDADRRRFERLARAARVPVWMTEWTHACPHGNCPDNPSVYFALPRAREIIRDLVFARAATWFLFRPVSDTSHGVDDGLIVRDPRHPGQPLRLEKRFAVFRQFSIVAGPGVLVHGVVERGGALPAVAFTRRHQLGLVVVNPGTAAARVSIDLRSSGGRLRGWRTSERQNFDRLPIAEPSRRILHVILPPASVTTYLLVS